MSNQKEDSSFVDSDEKSSDDSPKVTPSRTNLLRQPSQVTVPSLTRAEEPKKEPPPPLKRTESAAKNVPEIEVTAPRSARTPPPIVPA